MLKAMMYELSIELGCASQEMNIYDMLVAELLAPLNLKPLFCKTAVIVAYAHDYKILVKCINYDKVPCIVFTDSKSLFEFLLDDIIKFRICGDDVVNPYFKCKSVAEALVKRDLIDV